MAKRDESFNEFLKNFKAKNEQGWANIIDLTKEQQRERLLEKSPDYRKNEMIMMEEFRRRKNLQKYHELVRDKEVKESQEQGRPTDIADSTDPNLFAQEDTLMMGPDKFFIPGEDEVFDPSDFTLMFIDSDSVTNVTSMNRVNSRRVLLFIGNGNGIIGYAMGKGDDYEKAFENSFKTLKKNLICINLDYVFTVPRVLIGRHNDFKFKIFP
mmetsp:Transcript_34557/g.33761  ORF Transcript_34557/g.33761 Transcript_34557/m.33761 type:complete len:211 (-) Transcript_34557:268-900(-)|eukprot:CAMPEP_0170563022 /NCGR_PEP_ID=MMETSP0211-20121228/63745_1 /TAXON_ID=311385 /ORGANISM="Pseudokeronopsis sp., Strain OXSARD2" /LENGTH=210 /DNA_ID=CAMNT_0010880679 /DNA_START=171 /DNA_END=803 /DNA_ORIENTATION=-